jgi:UDP-N-acetylglucosamine 2-epimerase (non-hydrolysing)
MKVAPILREFARRGSHESFLVHTGQHYDDALSTSFFRDLDIPAPDVNLAVGSGTHGEQTASVLVATERVLLREHPDLVVVVGDVNSTLAAALAAAKLGISVAHVEAGLRSGDRSMPEEINRRLTDQISEILLTPSRDADENLRAEGVDSSRICFVGNVMIDSLDVAMARMSGEQDLAAIGLEAGPYALLTLHRPDNVDRPEVLREILAAMDEIARDTPVVFPAHPRAVARLKEYGLEPAAVRVIDPLPYFTMLSVMNEAAVVLTDSGGMQEEATVLGVPCLTLRPNTERPITISEGTNRLVADRSRESIQAAFAEAVQQPRRPCRPEGWDGRAALRIVDALEAWATS